MEHYYRPICEADDFDTEKYSGFVELQSTKVKDAILKAGLDLSHFAQWIQKGNIKGLAQVGVCLGCSRIKRHVRYS